MTLRIHNTLTRATERFTPIEPGHVKLYVCGITIYDLSHMGHARFLLAFDVVQRWLKTLGYRVTYVRNITDIDDKIIRRALERGMSIRDLTDEMIAAFEHDAEALGLERPTHEPRATEYVAEMLDMIGTLEKKGLGYRGSNGDVNFAVRKFPGYGKLSGKSLDQLRAGERVAVLDGKEDPLDFVMWKSAKDSEPDDAKWPSPYGPGRPGWHIECSAMCKALLGEHFDIHGGGQDLQFPHHENEIAQSEGASGGHVRQRLDAQRPAQHRQREDVEVARQLLHHPRCAAALRRRDDALLHGARALSQPVQLQRRHARRREERTAAPLHRARGDAAGREPHRSTGTSQARPHSARR